MSNNHVEQKGIMCKIRNILQRHVCTVTKYSIHIFQRFGRLAGYMSTGTSIRISRVIPALLFDLHKSCTLPWLRAKIKPSSVLADSTLNMKPEELGLGQALHESASAALEYVEIPLAWRKMGWYRSSIVFVHGLGGGREGTWTRGKVLWPKDLLPEDVPSARVLSFGYDAHIANFWSPPSQNTIKNHANSLLAEIVGLRDKTETVSLGASTARAPKASALTGRAVMHGTEVHTDTWPIAPKANDLCRSQPGGSSLRGRAFQTRG